VGVWSTVSDSFVLVDATATDVIKYEASRAYEKQKKDTLTHMATMLEENLYPYYEPFENQKEKITGEYPIGESGIEGARPLLTEHELGS